MRAAELRLETVEAFGEPGGIGLGSGDLALEAVEARAHDLARFAGTRDGASRDGALELGQALAYLGGNCASVAEALLQSLEFGCVLAARGIERAGGPRQGVNAIAQIRQLRLATDGALKRRHPAGQRRHLTRRTVLAPTCAHEEEGGKDCEQAAG